MPLVEIADVSIKDAARQTRSMMIASRAVSVSVWTIFEQSNFRSAGTEREREDTSLDDPGVGVVRFFLRWPKEREKETAPLWELNRSQHG